MPILMQPTPAPAPMPPVMHMPEPRPIQGVHELGLTAHNHAHVVGVIHHEIENVPTRRNTACQLHPTNPNKLWSIGF
jgi:hypothetical protein